MLYLGIGTYLFASHHLNLLQRCSEISLNQFLWVLFQCSIISDTCDWYLYQGFGITLLTIFEWIWIKKCVLIRLKIVQKVKHIIHINLKGYSDMDGARLKQ